MRAFLRFPKCYEVSIKLDLPTYLEKANLSEIGKEYLTNHLIDFGLLYYIRLIDCTEIPVYSATIINGCSKYDEINTAKYVAESVPYDCLVILRKANAVRIYFFERHANSRNRRRSCVDKYYQSRTLLFGKTDSLTSEYLKRIRNAIARSETKQQLYSELKGILSDTLEQAKAEHMDRLRQAGYLEYNVLTGKEYIFPREEIEVMCEIADMERKYDFV